MKALPEAPKDRVFFVDSNSPLWGMFIGVRTLGIMVRLKTRPDHELRIVLINAEHKENWPMDGLTTVIHELLHLLYLPEDGLRNLFERMLHEGLTVYETRRILMAIFLKKKTAAIKRMHQAIMADRRFQTSAGMDVFFDSRAHEKKRLGKAYNMYDGYADVRQTIEWLARFFVEGDAAIQRIYVGKDYRELFEKFPGLGLAAAIGNSSLYGRSTLPGDIIWKLIDDAIKRNEAFPSNLGKALLQVLGWFNRDGGVINLRAIARETLQGAEGEMEIDDQKAEASIPALIEKASTDLMQHPSEAGSIQSILEEDLRGTYIEATSEISDSGEDIEGDLGQGLIFEKTGNLWLDNVLVPLIEEFVFTGIPLLTGQFWLFIVFRVAFVFLHAVFGRDGPPSPWKELRQRLASPKFLVENLSIPFLISAGISALLITSFGFDLSSLSSTDTKSLSE